MKVKICGLSDLESAKTAVEAKADFIGFVFVQRVRRQISLGKARMVVRRLGTSPVKVVGLFANQPYDWVNKVANETGLDYVQLCGEEDKSYMQKIAPPVIRQVRVTPTSMPDDVKSSVLRHIDDGHLVLLDGKVPNSRGGTGKVWDWEIACGTFGTPGVFLAGGLTPDNLRDACNCCGEGYKPWGVDVSSGVETEGAKSVAKIQEFVRVAKQI